MTEQEKIETQTRISDARKYTELAVKNLYEVAEYNTDLIKDCIYRFEEGLLRQFEKEHPDKCKLEYDELTYKGAIEVKYTGADTGYLVVKEISDGRIKGGLPNGPSYLGTDCDYVWELFEASDLINFLKLQITD